MSNPPTAVSAPGKVLLAGGYLVLDRAHTGLVFGLSARINVIAQEIQTSSGVQINEIIVESPQFLDAQWRYGYHLVDEDGGIKVTQLQSGSAINTNPFVETTLSYVLTYISRVSQSSPTHSMPPARLTILADNDYYSHKPPASDPSIRPPVQLRSHHKFRPGRHSRFSSFGVPLSGAHKTGLGSSAALVTALTASLLTFYLPASSFSLSSGDGPSKLLLHNLAQAAHCAAQGKVGSGFDVAAAVYGSSIYRRFSPSLLASIPEPGTPGFSTALQKVVRETTWDTQTDEAGAQLPPGIVLRMADVDCGSATVGMVKKVLAWREGSPEAAGQLWGKLQEANDALGLALRTSNVEDQAVREAIHEIRKLVREMGELADVPIEPPSQTELLDALEGVEGVIGGVVPGAGGYDALALLVKDDSETERRMASFCAEWSLKKGTKVKMLGVKGETEGVRNEVIEEYKEWVKE